MMHLNALIDRVRQFPEISRQSGLVDKLTLYERRLGEAAKLLTDCVESERQIRSTFDAANVSRAGEQARRAALRAKKLYARLSERIEAVGDQATDRAVMEIGDAAKAAHANLREAWKQYIRQQTAAFRPLAEATRQAGLMGGDRLNRALADVAALENDPPKNAAATASARQRVDELVASVGALGLEGAAGKFLVDAASRGADPALLDDPDVRQFLTRYPSLWKVLRVKLG